MAYSSSFIRVLAAWARDGILPNPATRVVEIGSQMINAGTDPEALAQFARIYRPDFADRPLTPRYAGEMWRAVGIDYLSYDVTEAPDSRAFDLNFDAVPDQDMASADIVTNIGTTEHVVNQFNAFKVIHDLMKVGGVAIHQVPFTGMLNHCLFNYHPKFFYSLIVNNRYRLRHAEFSGPKLHADLGEGNTIFEGDRPRADAKVPGSEGWGADVHAIYSGVITLAIERRHLDDFVPPVDFAAGYFGETTGFDLGTLIGQDIPPHGVWADAFRRKTTFTQRAI